jgi:hypothetical protein
MGKVVPIGPLEWGVVAERHRELFGSKNCNVMSLQHKFNVIANTVPPTGDWGLPKSNWPRILCGQSRLGWTQGMLLLEML